jgi:hypothetical protein
LVRVGWRAFAGEDNIDLMPLFRNAALIGRASMMLEHWA